MGRPLFQVFHSMIPVWIAMLRLLKKAPKSFPSIRLLSETEGGTNFLVKVIRCGSRSSLQTDSFRLEKPPLRLHCVRKPLTHSFHLANPSPTRDSDSSNTIEYSTAPSTVETDGSPSHNQILERNPNFNLDKLKELAADYGSSYASAQSIFSEEESSYSGQEEETGNNAHAMAADAISEISDLQGYFQDWRTEPTSSNYRNLSARSARIFQQNEALVKYSEDPYLDFITSMTEMIATNSLTDYGDLEDLLRCYLYLNPSNYHDIIMLAFLEVLAAAFTSQSGS